MPVRAAWRDWLELTKPEISFLVGISTVAGFMMGGTGAVAWATLGWAVLGVTLASAGGCALNHYLERDLDTQMKRTASRPLPAGRIDPTHAAWFGASLVALGVGILCPLTNPLTGIMAGATVAIYLFVYTPMKRYTSLNTFVGTIPGALPALGGYTAATGTLGASGWVLFAVLVCWQIPHFYALAWMYRTDYARGGHQMLSVTQPDGKALLTNVVVFTVLMIGATLLPFWLGSGSAIYLAGAILLGLYFARAVYRFGVLMTNTSARQLLKATVYYIPALVLLIVLDRLLILS